MAKWSLCLVVLTFTLLHPSAQTAVSSQQYRVARGPTTFVGFDDILPRPIGKETVKKVYKREIIDDFTIDDETNLQNASSEAVPSPANDDLKPTPVTASEEDATEKISSDEDLLADPESASTGNYFEENKTNDEGHESTQKTGQFKAASGEELGTETETTDKTTVSTDVKSEESTVGEGNADDTEDISNENMKVGEGNDDVLGKLMAANEGSGDEDDNEKDMTTTDYTDNSDKTEITTVSDLSIDIDNSNEYVDSDEVEETSSVDISIDSKETIDTADVTPIPSPLPNKETSRYFLEDELLEVSTSTSTSTSEESGDEGSGDDTGAVGIPSDSQEIKSATEKTDPPNVVGGRNFKPIEENSTPGPPSQTEAVPQEGEKIDEIEIRKTGLGNTGSINEIGVKNDDEKITEVTEEKNSSSSGSFIVLGAIMVTIVVLLAYTVIKSRRQKKARRTANITKAAQEDQGREMKEVDKLLVPRTNGFSSPNGGPRDEERLPLKSFKEDFNEERPTKNGSLPEELTNVIVENVPRLNMAPKSNGTASNENQSENDQDSWVQGDGNALESTKIKMYIDEDSIPKTPIVIVNRGPAPN